MAPGQGQRDRSRRARRGHQNGRPRLLKTNKLEVRVQELHKALIAAAREAYTEMFGFREEHARAFPLDLSVVIEPASTWSLRAEPSLEDQIREAVSDWASRAEVLKSGRLYCYHCESSDCPHSIPPRPSSVFGGYTATGLPRWPDLTRVLLDLKNPRVDSLYDSEGGELIAAFMDAKHLKSEQLNVFGRLSKTYNVLGQVVFGFLDLVSQGERFTMPEHVAFSVQAVETRRIDGSCRFELNVLGRLWDGTPAMDALRTPYQLRVLKVISTARRKLQNLEPKSNRARRRTSNNTRSDGKARPTSILREMARSLERIGRQTGRRTVHAEERRVDNRPTSKAWEDAATTNQDNILWDVQRHTVVVVGPRHRVHVFSPEGRHVTSLLLDAEAVRSRMRRKRWKPLGGEILDEFSAAVGRENERASSTGDTSKANAQVLPEAIEK